MSVAGREAECVASWRDEHPNQRPAPTFDGFISQELPITSSINRIENYKGENYMVADLKQCILFPQQSGKLTINSGTYDLTVIQYENIRSFFGIMRQPVEKKIQVNSNSASIVIDPLPQPRPADFIGAVGQFTASLDMVNKQYKTMFLLSTPGVFYLEKLRKKGYNLLDASLTSPFMNVQLQNRLLIQKQFGRL